MVLLYLMVLKYLMFSAPPPNSVRLMTLPELELGVKA